MGNCVKKQSVTVTPPPGKAKKQGQRPKGDEDNLMAVFREFDVDGDGFIEEHELRQVMSRCGHKPSDDEIKAMFRAADMNGDGKISYEEFTSIAKANPLSLSLKSIFGDLDIDGDGYITKKELKQGFEKMGHRVTDADIDIVFREADKNADSKINFEEFVAMMCHRKS